MSPPAFTAAEDTKMASAAKSAAHAPERNNDMLSPLLSHHLGAHKAGLQVEISRSASRKGRGRWLCPDAPSARLPNYGAPAAPQRATPAAPACGAGGAAAPGRAISDRAGRSRSDRRPETSRPGG